MEDKPKVFPMEEFRKDIISVLRSKIVKRRIPSSLRENISIVLVKYFPLITKKNLERVIRQIVFNSHTDPVEVVISSFKNTIEMEEFKLIMKTRLRWVQDLNSLENINPEIDPRYYCGTCGKKSHLCHPVTGYCYHCRTDNWTSCEK